MKSDMEIDSLGARKKKKRCLVCLTIYKVNMGHGFTVQEIRGLKAMDSITVT